MSSPLSDRSTFTVRALLIGEHVNLKSLENADRLASNPLVIPAGDSGLVVLFRYGAVVLFGLSPVEEVSFLNHLKHLISQPETEPESEEAEIRVQPAAGERADNGIIWLQSASLERIQLVGDVLARSVVLAHYESTIADVFDHIEPLALTLRHKTVLGRKTKELLRHIGGTLLIQHKMVGRVEVEEKPEILWEHPELDRFYVRMAEEYELRERHRALERKLAVISRTAETLLSLIQHQHSLRVEWYIVILIVVEILLTLWDLFGRAVLGA